MPSPIRIDDHGIPQGQIIGWLTVYQSATPNVVVSGNATLRLDWENEPEPDACMWIRGGSARVSDDGYLVGAPELIVEVSATTASYDLHEKLRAYRRNGVGEYLVLLSHEQEVRWYNWQGGVEEILVPGGDGVIRSRQFAGLWLHPGRFWAGDLAGVLGVLQEGLKTRETTGSTPGQVVE